MNKTEIIEVMAAAADISKAAAARALDAFIDGIAGALSKNNNVALVGFGSFYVGKRKQRIGRNPRTGKSITIPAAKVPRFRAGKNLKERVNK